MVLAPVSIGNRTTSPAEVSGDVVTRATDKGTLEADADKLTGKFTPKKGK